MASTKTVKIIIVQHGQPRAYADHEYVYDLHFSQGDDDRIRSWTPSRDTALQYARAACPWVDKDDPKYNWASHTFVSFDMLEPTPDIHPKLGLIPPTGGHSDRWRIHVRAAYTD